MRNKLTQDQPTLFVDQYGTKLWAATARELHAQVGSGRVFKVYRDLKDGTTRWIGYGVGAQWFTAFKPVTV